MISIVEMFSLIFHLLKVSINGFQTLLYRKEVHRTTNNSKKDQKLNRNNRVIGGLKCSCN